MHKLSSPPKYRSVINDQIFGGCSSRRSSVPYYNSAVSSPSSLLAKQNRSQVQNKSDEICHAGPSRLMTHTDTKQKTVEPENLQYETPDIPRENSRSKNVSTENKRKFVVTPVTSLNNQHD